MTKVLFVFVFGVFVIFLQVSVSWAAGNVGSASVPIVRCDLLYKADSDNLNSPLSYVDSQTMKGAGQINLQANVSRDVVIFLDSAKEAGVLNFTAKSMSGSEIKMEDSKGAPFESTKISLMPLLGEAASTVKRVKDPLDGSAQMRVEGPKVYFTNPETANNAKSVIFARCTTMTSDSLALGLAGRTLTLEKEDLKKTKEIEALTAKLQAAIEKLIQVEKQNRNNTSEIDDLKAKMKALSNQN